MGLIHLLSSGNDICIFYHTLGYLFLHRAVPGAYENGDERADSS